MLVQMLMQNTSANSIIGYNEGMCNKLWKDYFEWPLNTTNNTEREQEHEQEQLYVEVEYDKQITAPPTTAVVQTALKALRNNRAPGFNGIPKELFKYGRKALVLSFHLLIIKIWEEENIAEDSKTSIICPI